LRGEPAGPKTPFRADIQGLRAVAVLAVLCYHARLGFAPGGYVGVDVFFVISGFLITGLLIREFEAKGRLSLSRFYARRIRRLLPAASVVLLFSLAVIALVGPASSRAAFAGDSLAAAGYVSNWRFAARAVDYLAANDLPSPLLHFWSLSIEEQFYIIWPMLLLVLIAVVRRTGWSFRRTFGVGLALVAVPSLLWSAGSTRVDASYAFFDTRTRLWELALGALVAVAAPLWPRVSRRIGWVLGWTGIGAIGWSIATVTADTPWPGVVALVPTLGAAAVIVAGSVRARASVATPLSWDPLVRVGDMSYSLYLWHWPLLMAATYVHGGFGWRGSSAIVALSLLPAWLSQRFVEDPLRYATSLTRSVRRTFVLGLVALAVVVGAGIAVVWGTRPQPPQPLQPRPSASISAVESPSDLEAFAAAVAGPEGGALAFHGGTVQPMPIADPPTIVPAPESAKQDLPEAYARGCQAGSKAEEPVWCPMGDVTSDFRVVVTGDSKMAQWLSALDAVGRARGWRIESVTKVACPFSDAYPMRRGHRYLPCEKWNSAVVSQLLADPPDLVVTSQVASAGYLLNDGKATDNTTENAVRGLETRWATLHAAGIPIVSILNNPGHPDKDNIPDCVARHRQSVDDCDFDRAVAESRGSRPVTLEAASRSAGVGVVDLTDVICRRDTCPAVIGGVLVYRDNHHLSGSYARTLAPDLGRALDEVVGEFGIVAPNSRVPESGP
jgi:peptidoglycan/LPS O-acetylase OafA/YrhL